MTVLALFIFFSLSCAVNRLDPVHRAKFEKTHRVWMMKHFPGWKPRPEAK